MERRLTLHQLPPRQKHPRAQVGGFVRTIDGEQASAAAA
jgi:hypothetical protein